MDSVEQEPSEKVPRYLGRFAWVVVGSTCVPCLFREDDTKYVSIRIVNGEVTNQFSKILKTEVLSCANAETFYMTEVESNLLNEINKFHCELYYDQQSFTDEDLIVKLNDVIDFYNFLDACRNLLLPESSSNTLFRKCGFMRINNDNNSIVPYVVKNKRKYLPIFYFDGETKSLEEKAITLENFDLAYLKFCCKMHGIKTDLFSGDKCLVTSLEQIKSYFTEDTIFEDFWPTQRLRPTPPVQENGNHSRGQAAAGTAVAVPSARRSVSSKKNRWDSPVRFDNNQKTNSFAATTNAYRTSLGSNSTMTNFTATTFSSPYPPTQSMKQSHSTQRKESIPPENWQR